MVTIGSSPFTLKSIIFLIVFWGHLGVGSKFERGAVNLEIILFMEFLVCLTDKE